MIPNPFNAPRTQRRKQVADRYEILEQLETNGSKQVFLARDLYSPGHASKCVVERLELPIQDTSQMHSVRQLFHAEAKLLSQLDRRVSLSHLLAHFEKENVFYTIREWIEGRSLDREIEVSAPWSDEQVVLFLYRMLSALKAIHQQGVLHLDLRPENLIRNRVNGRITLTNLGAFQQNSARAIASPPNINIPPIFNLSRYMPHEQIAGHPQPNSDLYAVGVMAIQALTGHVPGPLNASSLEREELQLPSFASLRHPSLLTFLRSMVRADYRDRFQSATEALSALESLPGDLTRSLLVASIFPSAEYSSNEWNTSDTNLFTDKDSKTQSMAQKLLPVGALLLLGASTAVWRAIEPIARIEAANRVAAVTSPEERNNSSLDREESLFGDRAAGSRAANSRGTAVQEPPESVGVPGENAAPGLLSQPSGFNEPIIGSIDATVSVGDRDALRAAAEADSEFLTLSPNAAKVTISRFYDRVANRSWPSVRTLLSAKVSDDLEPNFFDQFEAVSVDDYRVVSQTPTAIDLVVENTYVYLDGTSQREERNYTVEMVDNRPKITYTSFEKVTKHRS